MLQAYHVRMRPVDIFFDGLIFQATNNPNIDQSEVEAIKLVSSEKPMIAMIMYRRFRRAAFSDFPWQEFFEILLQLIEFFISNRTESGASQQ